jgi:hypothetical protein
MYKFNWINRQVESDFYFINQINFQIPASGCGYEPVSENATLWQIYCIQK